MEGFKRAATSDLSSRKISLAVVWSGLNGEDRGREAPKEGVSHESGGILGSASQILML